MANTSHAPIAAPEPQIDRLSWGIVEFEVTDLERSIAFWTSTLGLIERDQEGRGVALGTSHKTLFVLHSGARYPVAKPYTGMYHVAIGVRSQAEFSRILTRLIHLKVPVGPTDHLMAKSIYLHDPDGFEIEITLETPERFACFGDMSKGLTLYDVEGRPHNGREPLDVHHELSHAKGADVLAPLADSTYLAHLHLKVAALEPALDWFETLGFERHLKLDNWGFADMGAGAPNTHRLAMNIWAGPNLPPTPNDMARLIRYELIAHDPVLLTQSKLHHDQDVLRGCDPAGVDLTLRAFSN